MSAEELKQLYLSQKDEIASNIKLYIGNYEVLIVIGYSLVTILDEYVILSSKSNSMFKDMVLGDINLQLGLLSQYLSQIKKRKRLLIESYERSETAIQIALDSGSSGDIITAQSAYFNFEKEYLGVSNPNDPYEYNGGAKDYIKDYGELLTNMRKTMDEIEKDLFKILPRDDSGKVFKHEDEPEENIKMMMADANVRIFLLVVIGLLYYYLFFIDFDGNDNYQDNYNDNYHDNTLYQ
jgi:hypothetical protein